jgi:hypothetical protein
MSEAFYEPLGGGRFRSTGHTARSTSSAAASSLRRSARALLVTT